MNAHQDSGYVSYDDIERFFGISRRTLQYWIQATNITPDPDPSDNRRRMLKRSDVDLLTRTYPRDILQIVETAYGPFDALTRQLFRDAEMNAHGAQLRGAHLILAALGQMWPGLPSPQTPLLNKFLSDITVRNAYETAILRRLLREQMGNTSHEAPAFGSDPVSSDLARALTISHESVEPDQMNIATLIRAILLVDQEIAAIFTEVPATTGISREKLLDELDKVIPMSSYTAAGALTSVVEPSTGHRYARRHAVFINEILDRLAFRELSEFVLCSGLVGSLLNRVPRILADIIDQGEHGALATYWPQLGMYKHLLTLDIGALQLVDVATAEQALTDELQNSIVSKSILLLRRFQLITPDETSHHAAVNSAILKTLTSKVASAAVIAIFEPPNESSQTPLDLYSDLPLLIVEPQTYKPNQTLSVIEDYYSQEWAQNDGVKLADGALDTVFALESAVYVQRWRKTLPYLAVDLAGEALATMRSARLGQGSSLAYGLYRNAADSIEHMWSRESDVKSLSVELEDYASHKDEAVRELAQEWIRRLRAIAVAEQEILDVLSGAADLAANRTADDYELLTRPAINAQFFGSHRYELRVRSAFEYELRVLLSPKR